MLTKHNITDIIADHKTRIFCKRLEYAWAKTEEEKLRIQTELDFLEDNCCRYEMQARAWVWVIEFEKISKEEAANGTR